MRTPYVPPLLRQCHIKNISSEPRFNVCGGDTRRGLTLSTNFRNKAITNLVSAVFKNLLVVQQGDIHARRPSWDKYSFSRFFQWEKPAANQKYQDQRVVCAGSEDFEPHGPRRPGRKIQSPNFPPVQCQVLPQANHSGDCKPPADQKSADIIFPHFHAVR